MTRPPLVLFTDLDGTLLDHETYSHAAADAVLARLRDAEIPVVLASSKTAAEIAALRRALGFAHVPAICENGAGLLPAFAEDAAEAGDHARIRAALEALPAALREGFRGFSQLSVAELADLTGLPRQQAALAGQRRFTEPGLWTGGGEDRRAFVAALAALGIEAREGGRFLTLGTGRRKADRMAEILAGYGDPPCLALGDAPNDVEMLEAATWGVIVANPHRAPLPRLPGEDTGRIIRTTLPGPEGWSQAVTGILSRNGIGTGNE
ncbi:MAG: HAD-IIB family hydrolase [Paracoccaceae bacterium]